MRGAHAPRAFFHKKKPTMHIKQEYDLREIAGEHIVVIQGQLDADMTRVIALNESGAWLWEELSGKDFSPQQAAELLCSRYEVEVDTALSDAEKWIETLEKCGAIEA